MSYFIDEKKRKESQSSSYFEFQKGKYRDKCWLPDSISIHMDIFDDLHLYDLIRSVIPAFDYYGLTEITPGNWEKIIRKAHLIGGETEAAMIEADKWVKNAFSNEPIFTICGI